MKPLEFKIQGDFIELAQLLKVCGIAETGGHAKLLIKNSGVLVDGKIELRRGCKIRPGQSVAFESAVIHLT